MSKLLIQKKGRTPIVMMVLGLIFLVVSVGWLASGEMGHEFGNSETDDFIKNAPPVLMMFAGVLLFLGAACFAKTGVAVYDDHIEGVGIGKGAFAPHSFYFAKNYTVQCAGATLKVTCGAETYSVSLTVADAQEVYRCVNTRKPAASTAPEARTTSASGISSMFKSQPTAAPKTTPNPAPSAATTREPAPAPKSASAPKPAPTPNPAPTPQPTPSPAPSHAETQDPESAPKSRIATCPTCGAKCRVPRGKGLIRITCPNPDCKVPFTFNS